MKECWCVHNCKAGSWQSHSEELFSLYGQNLKVQLVDQQLYHQPTFRACLMVAFYNSFKIQPHSLKSIIIDPLNRRKSRSCTQIGDLARVRLQCSHCWLQCSHCWLPVLCQLAWSTEGWSRAFGERGGRKEEETAATEFGNHVGLSPACCPQIMAGHTWVTWLWSFGNNCEDIVVVNMHFTVNKHHLIKAMYPSSTRFVHASRMTTEQSQIWSYKFYLSTRRGQGTCDTRCLKMQFSQPCILSLSLLWCSH